MLDREVLLKKLTEQVKYEYENPSQVEVDTDRFVATKGREQCPQLLLDKEGISINAKSSHSHQRGQEGGATQKKFPKSDLRHNNNGSCHVYVQEDTPAIVRLHNKQMVNGEKKQHHQPELGGTIGGQEGGATPKKTPKPNPCNDKEEACQDYALVDKVYTEGEDMFDKGFAVQLEEHRKTAMVESNKYVQQEQGETSGNKAYFAQSCELERSTVVGVGQTRQQPMMPDN